MTDEAGPPVSRRREATRQRLVDAAAQVFAETGLDAASVEAICERAGYTRGAFYSNFDSKEELFLTLCARTSQAQIDLVHDRVARFTSEGPPEGVGEVVREVLEIAGEDRDGVLLLNEIRLHALRSPSLAAAYLAQEEALAEGVARIVSDVARVTGVRLRVPAPVAARALLAAWTTGSSRAVMAGLDPDELRVALRRELAEIAELVIEH